MKATLQFSQDDFARILDGERDGDLRRNLSNAVLTGCQDSIVTAIGKIPVRQQSTGRQGLSALTGPLGSAGFNLAQLHREGGFFCWDYSITTDTPKGGPRIEAVVAGEGLGFDYVTTQLDGKVWPPRLEFREMLRWDRLIVRFLALHIDSGLLPLSAAQCSQCECPMSYLRPVTESSTSELLSWVCICCGRIYLCSCSKGYLETLAARPMHENRAYIELERTAQYRDEVCHLCRRIPSETKFRSEMYGGFVYQHYFPYIQQEAALGQLSSRDAENKVRDRLNIPRIGEGWVNEMLLINSVRYLFPDLQVEHQAGPIWLGQQRYDGYIPKYKVAIEYNGEQHYSPVDRFGGIPGLLRTQERDRRKLEISMKSGVEVVVFRFDEKLSESSIRSRVQKAIEKQTSH